MPSANCVYEVTTVLRYRNSIIMPRPYGREALSADAHLTSDVCLLRTSGLSREQRGLGRLKLAQR